MMKEDLEMVKKSQVFLKQVFDEEGTKKFKVVKMVNTANFNIGDILGENYVKRLCSINSPTTIVTIT